MNEVECAPTDGTHSLPQLLVLLLRPPALLDRRVQVVVPAHNVITQSMVDATVSNGSNKHRVSSRSTKRHTTTRQAHSNALSLRDWPGAHSAGTSVSVHAAAPPTLTINKIAPIFRYPFSGHQACQHSSGGMARTNAHGTASRSDQGSARRFRTTSSRPWPCRCR